jgi:hypothetical protein
VCGSRIEPDGKVVITTPSPGCVPGQVLYVIGSPSEFAMGDRPDWVLRLLDPPANGGKPGNEGARHGRGRDGARRADGAGRRGRGARGASVIGRVLMARVPPAASRSSRGSERTTRARIRRESG